MKTGSRRWWFGCILIGLLIIIQGITVQAQPFNAVISISSSAQNNEQLAKSIREIAIPITGQPNDYQPLLDQIGDAHIVMIGDASHGTHEFYAARAEITRLLIEKKGFMAVAVEADWPDAYRVNRYVRSWSRELDAQSALGNFKKFPLWMWRNTDVLNFVRWLRAYNTKLLLGEQRVGFYGLDLYSLYTSRRVDELSQAHRSAVGTASE
jgi:erythromycin esterase-like protein